MLVTIMCALRTLIVVLACVTVVTGIIGTIFALIKEPSFVLAQISSSTTAFMLAALAFYILKIHSSKK